MCNCIDLVNEKLQEKNTRICVTFSLSGGPTRVALTTEKIEPRGKRSVLMMPTFCPFCGQNYEKDDENGRGH